MFTFSAFLADQLVNVVEELADLFLLFDAFLLLIEGKQLAFEDNLKNIALVEIFDLFLSLQPLGQEAEEGSFLQLTGIADDLLGLLWAEPIDESVDTGDNLHNKALSDLGGDKLVLQVFQDLDPNKRQVHSLAFLDVFYRLGMTDFHGLVKFLLV